MEQPQLDQLATFDQVTLEQLRDRLDQELTTRLALTEIVFGLINRVGLIPGILTVLTALVTASKGAAPGALLGLEALTFLFLVAYNASIGVQIAVVEVRIIIMLLNKTIGLKIKT